MTQLKKVTALLKSFLADTYALYLKTQNYHWNVEGTDFFSYHKFFEEQYEELAAAVDEIAERIRQLGEKTPASFKDFLDLMSISEALENITALDMIRDLVKSHEKLAHNADKLIEQCDKEKDEGTMDMIIQRLKAHQKAIWMLKSHLD